MNALVLLLALSFRLEGGIHQLEQSPRPEGPYLVTPHEERVFVGDDGVIVHEVKTIWPYFTSQSATRIEPDDESPAAEAARARVRRRHPDLLSGGERVSAIEWRSRDPLLGDLLLRVEYDWEGDQPVAYRQYENGRLVLDAKYRDVRRGGEAPEVAAKEEAPPPAPAPVALVRLGANVDLIRNAGGADYHSLLVRFADHLVVVEGPRSARAAREAIAAIRRRYPSLPIRDVVVTHHHYDHIAGLPAYVADGARVVTTTGNVAYLQSLLGPSAEVVAVPSGYGVTDSLNEMILFDAGPTEHVDEVLVAWLPRQKILFQGDLYRHDPDSSEPPRQSALQLAAFLAARNLEVRLLAGVHGNVLKLVSGLEKQLFAKNDR
ncbi:MAG TPA: MBL fold metallo-hydrolase [Thermoanaerobaculia bacterium]|nr:MBL fold metallo-hydrolase [Thermoanaerobaculia bacterium]